MPIARWTYGCSEVRANGDVKRLIEDAADLGGRQAIAAEAERADAARMVAMAEDLVAADFVEPSPETFDQFDFVLVDLARPCSSTYWMPAARPATPRTFGVPPSRKYGNSLGCVSLDESPPVPPSRQGRSLARGPT